MPWLWCFADLAKMTFPEMSLGGESSWRSMQKSCSSLQLPVDGLALPVADLSHDLMPLFAC